MGFAFFYRRKRFPGVGGNRAFPGRKIVNCVSVESSIEAKQGIILANLDVRKEFAGARQKNVQRGGAEQMAGFSPKEIGSVSSMEEDRE